ncbi:MAG: cation:proton antiporter [Acidimicrobiales bacterium]|nr:cation:proton antiporter [Acidimicrobiales bacterium]
MDIGSIAVAAGALLVWTLVSARLGRIDVTGPMALVVLGAAADATGLVSISPRDAELDTVAAGALALILFADASRIDIGRLRRQAGLPVRLLGIGLPLTLGAGAVAAYLLWPDDGWGAALLVAACLAPTDAGLGSVIVTDPAVPRPIRRALNVESGLNDGIASPVVLLAIALTLAEEQTSGGFGATALEQLAIGLAVGVVVGAGGGRAVAWTRARGGSDPEVLPLATLALAVLAYAGAVAVEGNGFISAFVAGLAFAPITRQLPDGAGAEEVPPVALAELGGQLLGSFVWFLFGAALLGPVLDGLGTRDVLYAVASLTVIRMVPVALALAGARVPWATVGFLGWFGPRGLASLVFVIEAIDEVGREAGDRILSVVGITVALSVVAHGASASPLARRYGRFCDLADHHAADLGEEMPTRMPLGRSMGAPADDSPA